MEGNTIWEAVQGVFAACGDLSAQDRLDVLLFAWLVLASQARTEALIAPGGFPAVRDRQAARLRTMADLVASDEPDLEMERLFQEGDIAGMLRHVQALREGEGPDLEKGGA